MREVADLQAQLEAVREKLDAPKMAEAVRRRRPYLVWRMNPHNRDAMLVGFSDETHFLNRVRVTIEQRNATAESERLESEITQLGRNIAQRSRLVSDMEVAHPALALAADHV